MPTRWQSRTHQNITPDVAAREIAGMLALILAKQSVAPDDDFFALGGDSLSATELMIAIESRFGLVLDPVEIFEQPNIRLFAEIVCRYAQR